jgi:hypothetical protein
MISVADMVFNWWVTLPATPNAHENRTKAQGGQRIPDLQRNMSGGSIPPLGPDFQINLVCSINIHFSFLHRDAILF